VPGWIELDKAEEWHKLPSGAIVVIDEAQRIFRPRGNGTLVPEHVSQLETHRHRGLDLYVVTQHPMLVDSNVRRLVGRHVHVMRSFGLQRATLHEWGTVKEQCDKARDDSNKTEWAYPKQVFAAYHSAEVHTHKRRVPKRLIFLLMVPALLAACGWMFVRWYQHFGESTQHKAGGDSLAASAPGGSAPAKSGPVTVEGYLASYKPRVEGLPQSAPRYDEVTKAVTAPVPVACVAAAARCRCYSQQGTRMDTPDQLCRQFADRGFFVDFELRDPRAKQDAERDRLSAKQNRTQPVETYAGPPRGVAVPLGDPPLGGEGGTKGGLSMGLVDGRLPDVGGASVSGATPDGGPPRMRPLPAGARS
jgi:hypothetical protein